MLEKSIRYQHLIEYCFSEKLGKGGTPKQEYTDLLNATRPILMSLKEQKESNQLPLLNIPFDKGDLKDIMVISKHIAEVFEEVVIFGTGGSSLNGKALLDLRLYEPLQPRLHFVDTIDPSTIERLFASLDLTRTAFISISKSGRTAETLAQTLIALESVRHVSKKYFVGEQFFFVTEESSNPLRDIGENIGATLLVHPTQIGGRYAGLSAVGLLPAAIAGLDIYAIREGAAEVVEEHTKGAYPFFELPEAAKGAALCVSLLKHHYTLSVMMPYVDRLSGFANWYRQLWAESLGKQGKGMTPIKAMGTVDQHSQLQLYLDGPQDKMFSLIRVATRQSGPTIFADFLAEDERINFLHHHSIGALHQAEYEATVTTLKRKGCPVRQFLLSEINEASIGALMMHFMIETIITAALIEVNPFDQPAVEEGKLLAKQTLEELKFV